MPPQMVEVHNYRMTQPVVVALIWRTALLRGRLNLEVRLYRKQEISRSPIFSDQICFFFLTYSVTRLRTTVPPPFLVALIWRTALLRGRLNLEV